MHRPNTYRRLRGWRVKRLPAMQETQVQFLGQEDPLEKGMATHFSILAWRIQMDRGAEQAPVHGVAKSWTPLSSFTFFLSFSYPVDKRGKQTRHHDPWCERRIPAPSLSQEGLSWRGSTGLFIGLDSYKKTFQ